MQLHQPNGIELSSTTLPPLPGRIGQAGTSGGPANQPYFDIASMTVDGGTQTAGGWAITGPGPGFLITVNAWADSNKYTPLGITFSYAGTNADIPCDEQAKATFQFRAYRPGNLTVTASPYGTATSSSVISHGTASSMTIAVSLARTVPALTLTAPSSGARFSVTKLGANIAVGVTTDDTAQFGQFLVSAQPDVGTPADLSPDAGSTTHWSGTAILAALPLGSRTITVTCACAEANDVKASATVPVTVYDIDPPTVTVTNPPSGGAIVADPQTMTVQIRGTAADEVSGVAGGHAGVAVALSPTGSQTAATPGSPGDWSSWSAAIQVPDYGPSTLYVWATDAAGNAMPAPKQWPFDVVSSYPLHTLEQRLSDVEYLSALMQFAADQVNAGTGGAVTSAAITGTLGQPLDTISVPGSAPAAAAQQPVERTAHPGRGTARPYGGWQHRRRPRRGR